MMKQILQIKRRKIPAVPASSIASSKARSTQKTLHALFTCTPEQREAANRQRLCALLAQKCVPPGRPPGEDDPRKASKAGQVPHLAGDGGRDKMARDSVKVHRSIDGKDPKGKDHRVSSSQDHDSPTNGVRTGGATQRQSSEPHSAVTSSTPGESAERRPRRDIPFIDRIPRMYNLAKGDDHRCSYVVSGFEEYMPQQKERSGSSQRGRDKCPSSQLSNESKSNTVKNGKESRLSSTSQERESRRKEHRDSRDCRTTSKETDRDAAPKEATDETQEKKELRESPVADGRPAKDISKISIGNTNKDELKKHNEERSQSESSRDGGRSGSNQRRHRDHHEHRSGKRRKDRSRTSDSGTGSLYDKDRPCTISVETVRVTERDSVPSQAPPTSISPPFAKKPCLVVSPAATEATAVTSTSTCDQRLPDNREVSALKEIVTNYQVPSMIGRLAEKSPSCTPTHSVVPPLPADLDRRVLDWVDNCVSQGNNNNSNGTTKEAQIRSAMTSSSVVNGAPKASTEATCYDGPLRDLQRSYLRLVDSEECSDLVIETEERPIRAHKAILFVRCPKLTQTVSADSSFWQLSWCCAKAAILFLRYLYAADVSFVASVEGRVRKDLLTLCCQYQTDELAARLIRERSPSPLPSQLQPRQISQQQQHQQQQQRDARVASSVTALLATVRSRKRCSSPDSLRQRQQRVRLESDVSSENASDTGSSTGKKTRMSITCETVSVTAPTSEDRHRIQQSPRLPQPSAQLSCGQHGTPLVQISDDEDDDGLLIAGDSRAPNGPLSPVKHSALSVAGSSGGGNGGGPRLSTGSPSDTAGVGHRLADGVSANVTGGGTADEPIELGSSSDLFSDEDVVVGAIMQTQPPPPLSPIQPTPRRVPDDDDEELLPLPPASLRAAIVQSLPQRISPMRKSASPAARSNAPASSASSVMSSPSTSMRLLHRTSYSQPAPSRLLDDDDDDEDGEELCEEEFNEFAGVPQDAGVASSPVRPITPVSNSSRVSRLVGGRCDVTPQPRYSLMKTPEMHAQLDQYGIKPSIGKRKAVQLLKHIYQSTHPEVPDPAEPDQEATSADRDAPPSSSSDESDGELPLEETMVHDDDEEISENVEDKITRYIKNTPALYDKILRYEPLEVVDFKRELREHGIRVNDKTLLNLLDYHCVNISFGAQRKTARSPKKPRRKKIIRKPPLQTNPQRSAMTQP